MTKRILALLATLALVAAMAVGCGGGDPSDKGMAPEQQVPGKEVTTPPSVPADGSGQGSSDGK